MSLRRSCALSATALLVVALAVPVALAHSASDAYISLDAQTRPNAGGGETVLHGQWDIALRDLDFALKLDDNGDGKITWGELQKHQAQIAQYAYGFLTVRANGKACTIQPTRQMVDNHADGAYVALFFSAICAGAAQRVTLQYQLFFGVDPSHRGILVFRSGGKTATSLLSPGNAKVDLGL